MADKIQITKNSLDILSQASDLASKISAVSKILGIASKLTSTFPFVGAVLGLVECFLPDAKHEEILRCFEKLNNKVDQVRDDIKELEKMIKWETTQLQYGEVVGRITLGMQHCTDIGSTTEKAKKHEYRERLKEACANGNFTLAIDALFDGITGDGLFRKSILDEFYDKTKGDRQKISGLAIRLLQLLCGGIIVLATNEAMVHGKVGAEEVTKPYERRMKKVYAKVQSVIDMCVVKFQENMLNDLNAFLDTGRPNKGLVTELSNFMRTKYDWLENFCMVYNDLCGFHQHCINGYHVSSLHRNEKCGVVFYRTKGEPPRFSSRYDEVYKIVDGAYKMIDVAWYGNAEEAQKNIVYSLEVTGIAWSGCTVITCDADLGFGGTFSSKIVSIIEGNTAAILLLQ